MNRPEFLASLPMFATVSQLVGLSPTKLAPAASAAAVALAASALAATPLASSGQFFVGGLGPPPEPYLRVGRTASSAGRLQKAGTDVAAEQSAMFGYPTASQNIANANIQNMKLTLFPHHMNPRHNDPIGIRSMGPGNQKNYAALVITLTQGTNLPVLPPQQLLSWANIWNFVQFSNNNRGDDVIAQPLPPASLATPGSSPWTNMPLPNGDGQLDIGFVVGTADQTMITLSNIVNALAPFLVTTGSPLTGLQTISASSLSLILAYENLILSAAKQLTRGAQFGQVIQSPAPIAAATHYQSTQAHNGSAIRFPAGDSEFALVPAATLQGGPDDFDNWIQTKSKQGKTVTLRDDGTPVILDASGSTVDSNEWDNWTIVTLGASVTAS